MLKEHTLTAVKFNRGRGDGGYMTNRLHMCESRELEGVFI